MTSDIDIGQLYMEYSNKVMGYISARVRNHSDAEDLCADVIEKIQRKIGD